MQVYPIYRAHIKIKKKYITKNVNKRGLTKERLISGQSGFESLMKNTFTS